MAWLTDSFPIETLPLEWCKAYERGRKGGIPTAEPVEADAADLDRLLAELRECFALRHPRRVARKGSAARGG